MRLICDDYNGIYVWVEDHDENQELSPHFDYEDDAIQWKLRLTELITGNKTNESSSSNSNYRK